MLEKGQPPVTTRRELGKYTLYIYIYIGVGHGELLPANLNGMDGLAKL